MHQLKAKLCPEIGHVNKPLDQGLIQKPVEQMSIQLQTSMLDESTFNGYLPRIKKIKKINCSHYERQENKHKSDDRKTKLQK